ncbi:PIR Superfamily Protein [Plasmodium ovale curtisi]|uniref:PIR Superfamily Protein n=1 Tax=Plasmodium ovale curtisi TaxID=864141 RepID=A0A1A8WLG3_PLAOA|nr:PIR Superfamily Protein [Plasmodium ovale curtisi]SBT01829.1 PIR Superfamily Protein [Plasmodium ovale curtisi]
MKTKSYSYLNTNTVLKKNVKSTYFNTNYDEYLFTLRRKGLYINNSRTPVIKVRRHTQFLLFYYCYDSISNVHYNTKYYNGRDTSKLPFEFIYGTLEQIISDRASISIVYTKSGIEGSVMCCQYFVKSLYGKIVMQYTLGGIYYEEIEKFKKKLKGTIELTFLECKCSDSSLKLTLNRKKETLCHKEKINNLQKAHQKNINNINLQESILEHFPSTKMCNALDKAINLDLATTDFEIFKEDVTEIKTICAQFASNLKQIVETEDKDQDNESWFAFDLLVIFYFDDCPHYFKCNVKYNPNDCLSNEKCDIQVSIEEIENMVENLFLLMKVLYKEV